jgi:hypothetical protein
MSRSLASFGISAARPVQGADKIIAGRGRTGGRVNRINLAQLESGHKARISIRAAQRGMN